MQAESVQEAATFADEWRTGEYVWEPPDGGDNGNEAHRITSQDQRGDLRLLPSDVPDGWQVKAIEG